MAQGEPANAARLGLDGGDAIQFVPRPDMEAVEEGDWDIRLHPHVRRKVIYF
jgi:hypothetical protein